MDFGTLLHVAKQNSSNDKKAEVSIMHLITMV